MKKLKIKILLTMLISMVGVNATAYDISVTNEDGVRIYYNWINNNTELSVCIGGAIVNLTNSYYNGVVNIPGKVVYQGVTYPVTTITGSAFAYSKVTSVSIPNTVRSIGTEAFRNCKSLSDMIIPNSVSDIGATAFLGCTNLKSLTIGNSVKTIGAGAFSECSSLEEVTIPSSVETIAF